MKCAGHGLNFKWAAAQYESWRSQRWAVGPVIHSRRHHHFLWRHHYPAASKSNVSDDVHHFLDSSRIFAIEIVECSMSPIFASFLRFLGFRPFSCSVPRRFRHCECSGMVGEVKIRHRGQKPMTNNGSRRRNERPSLIPDPFLPWQHQ